MGLLKKIKSAWHYIIASPERNNVEIRQQVLPATDKVLSKVDEATLRKMATLQAEVISLKKKLVEINDKLRTTEKEDVTEVLEQKEKQDLAKKSRDMISLDKLLSEIKDKKIIACYRDGETIGELVNLFIDQDKEQIRPRVKTSDGKLHDLRGARDLKSLFHNFNTLADQIRNRVVYLNLTKKGFYLQDVELPINVEQVMSDEEEPSVATEKLDDFISNVLSQKSDALNRAHDAEKKEDALRIAHRIQGSRLDIMTDRTNIAEAQVVGFNKEIKEIHKHYSRLNLDYNRLGNVASQSQELLVDALDKLNRVSHNLIEKKDKANFEEAVDMLNMANEAVKTAIDVSKPTPADKIVDDEVATQK